MVNQIKNIKSTISILNKQISKLEEKVNKESKKLISQGFKDLFKRYPDLKSFSWTQYTPYFNDGDECIFGANTEYLSINGSEEEESVYQLRKFLDDLEHPRKAINALNKRIEEYKKNKWDYAYLEESIKQIQNASIEDTIAKLKMLEDIDGVLSCISNDTYRDMFGDHVKVNVTKDGWTTEGYEHD